LFLFFFFLKKRKYWFRRQMRWAKDIPRKDEWEASPNGSEFVKKNRSQRNKTNHQPSSLALTVKTKMKVVALVSGGKDSCYAMMKSIQSGHEVSLSLSSLSCLFPEKPTLSHPPNIPPSFIISVFFLLIFFYSMGFYFLNC
jgi:hypothetical protein